MQDYNSQKKIGTIGGDMKLRDRGTNIDNLGNVTGKEPTEYSGKINDIKSAFQYFQDNFYNSLFFVSFIGFIIIFCFGHIEDWDDIIHYIIFILVFPFIYFLIDRFLISRYIKEKEDKE